MLSSTVLSKYCLILVYGIVFVSLRSSKYRPRKSGVDAVCVGARNQSLLRLNKQPTTPPPHLPD